VFLQNVASIDRPDEVEKIAMVDHYNQDGEEESSIYDNGIFLYHLVNQSNPNSGVTCRTWLDNAIALTNYELALSQR